MSERSIHYVPTFPSFFSKLFYSNALGIMRSPEFAIRDYKEDNFVLIYTARGCLFAKIKAPAEIFRKCHIKTVGFVGVQGDADLM